jgi:hypothetical protein
MNAPSVTPFRPPGRVRGLKREAIEELFNEFPDMSAEEIARRVGCSKQSCVNLLSVLRLRALANKPIPAGYLVAKIYESCMARLASLAGRVRQGLDVEGALDFTRWLTFSGLPQLFDGYGSNSQLPVSRRDLDEASRKLAEQCLARIRSGDLSPQLDAAEIKSLAEKLTNIERVLAQQKAA